jgi:hypothetical protein
MKKRRSSGGGTRPFHGEQRSGPVAGTAIVNGATFQGKGLQYAVVDGQAIFEGDIVLGPVEAVREAASAEGALRSIVIPGASARWPGGLVPFEIDSGLPNQQRVHDAIAHWQSKTRIRFRARTSADADFVRFVAGGGCSSSVGRQGGAQNVTLASACSAGNCIHEIGHTIGLWHEQSREDRDAFVTIAWANIDPAMQHNFSQHISDGDDVGAYDFGSIMHYPADAFSNNGQNTIVPKQPIPSGVVMGQRSALSAGDIAGVASMYGGVVTIKEAAKDPLIDTSTIKEAGKDPIDDATVKEVRKDPISDTTVKEARKDPINDTTIKEARKDLVSDTTIKEARKDPVSDFTVREAGSPFVLAAPSRAPGAMDRAAQAAGPAAAQVERLAQAIALAEQQHAELVAAYDAAVQMLAAVREQG